MARQEARQNEAVSGSSPSPYSSEILSIQYLRAVAASMVVWHHAAGQVPGMSSLVPWAFGTSGVDLFFVISGFIMVVTTVGRAVRPVDFWRRRIVRVVPLYWLLTLAMVLVALVAPSLFKTLKVAPATLLQSLLFIPHYSQSFPERVWPLLVPGWTLNFEMFFYAVFGASLFLRREHSLMAMTVAILILVVTGMFLRPLSSAAAQTYTNPMLLEFLAGAWICVWWARGGSWLPVEVSVVMLFAGGAFLVLRDEPPFGGFNQIVGASLVVAGALNKRFYSWRSAVLLAVGDSSYSLYLTHIFTLGLLRLLWVRLYPSAPSVLSAEMFMVTSLLACAGVGWLTYRCIERPLLRRLNRVGGSPSAKGLQIVPEQS